MTAVRDKVMLITGAAGGIGSHLTAALAGRGAHVIATAHDTAELETCAKAQGWRGVTCRTLDVRSWEDWRRVTDETLSVHGRVDVLLHVAGVLKPGRCWEVDPAEIDRHADINLKGVQLGTRAVAPSMVARGQGHVVCIGSLASLSPLPGNALYGASKFGVRGFALGAAMELAPHGVAVTLVMPDAVETPMLDLQRDFDEAAMTFSGSRPLRPEEITDAILRVVLPQRPLELPIPQTRGLLARLSSLAPASTARLLPLMIERGRRAKHRKRAV